MTVPEQSVLHRRGDPGMIDGLNRTIVAAVGAAIWTKRDFFDLQQPKNGGLAIEPKRPHLIIPVTFNPILPP
ncbi:MAG: hypothetical protein QE272_09625 [Nevskia sp.]|nr:hypothetical protein [Nevskia sp.]